MNKLKESINDKYLFKCIFLAGGPGSGKSFITESLSSLYNIGPDLINYTRRLNVDDVENNKPNSSGEAKELVKSKYKYSAPVKQISNENISVINSDDVFEYLLTKNNVTKKLTFDPENPLYDIQQGLRKHAKSMTSARKESSINGMLPIIVDGTGKDFNETMETIKALENVGYDVTMIFVDVPLNVSLDRNEQRERSLQPNMVEEIWTKCQANIEKYRTALQEDFIKIDNMNDIIYDPYYEGKTDRDGNSLYPTMPDENNLVSSYKKNLRRLGRRIFTSKLKNPKGISELNRLRAEGKKYLN